MKNFLLFTRTIFSICIFSLISIGLNAQNSTCATAASLQLDTNCAGTTGGLNSGDPTGNDDTDGNVCSSSYSGGDDFIFMYTATTTDALQLDLNATNTWTGLMVTAGCPTVGTCFASSTSSSSNESLTTPSMTIGQVYYIHVSTWPSPQSAGQFCLDAQLIAPPTPPTNDECVDAVALTVNADLSCTAVTSGTINLATASADDTSTCFGTEDDDVWYSFVATATEHPISLINVANGTTDLYHSVWSGTCGSLSNILCSDPNTSSATGLTIGDTYYLRVYSWTSTPNQTTTFDVCIGTNPPPPANDACIDAIAVFDGSTQAGTITSATNVEGLSPCSGGAVGAACAPGVNDGSIDFGPGVWFIYNSSGMETVTLELDGFDTELQVFSGSCGSLTCVAGDDDSSSSGANGSQVCFETTASFAPVDYYIYVDGHGSSSGNFTLTVSTAAILPAELTTFSGKAMEKYNALQWKTASEQNTAEFAIERSINGRDSWEVIGTERAAGNSESEVTYSFNDMRPITQSYYRLRTLDLDGSTQISNIISIKRAVNGFDVVNVAPNPTTTTTNVTFESSEEMMIEAVITDVTGKVIQILNQETTKGLNNLEVDLSQTPNGVYFLTLNNGTKTVTNRIIKN